MQVTSEILSGDCIFTHGKATLLISVNSRLVNPLVRNTPRVCRHLYRHAVRCIPFLPLKHMPRVVSCSRYFRKFDVARCWNEVRNGHRGGTGRWVLFVKRVSRVDMVVHRTTEDVIREDQQSKMDEWMDALFRDLSLTWLFDENDTMSRFSFLSNVI